MSWLRIEGRMPRNRKVSALSDAAFRLYVTASCWCVEEETDGLIPAHVPETLPRAPRGKALKSAIAELVTHGVWETRDDGQHVIHDHLVYNPSAAQSKAVREAKALAGAAGGRARANGLHGKNVAPASPPSKQTPSKQVAYEKQKPSLRAGAGARSDSDSDPESETQSQPDGSEDLTGQPDDDARPGWLARSKEFPRKPGEEPQPRRDELAEKIPFSRWAVPQQLLDYAKEKRLPDAKFDAALIELRDKCQGLHDVAWWDLKAIAFIRNAIAWHENPKSKSGPVQTSTGLDDESAALLQRLRAIP